MTTIGRSLSFYLKYFQEMEELYIEDNSELLDDHEDMENIEEMVNTVGELADEQAADFLKEAAESVIRTVSPFCRAKIGNKRVSLKDNWRIDIWFWPKRRQYIKNRYVQFVIGINEIEGQPALYTAIWVKGRNAGEEKIARILGNLVSRRSKDLKWHPGNLLLGIDKIDVSGNGPDKQALIDKVSRHIEKIPQGKYQQIFKCFN